MHFKKITGFFALLLILPAFFVLSAKAKTEVIPGGDAVAVRLQSDGAIVIGFSDEEKDNPARRAGIRRGDRITKIGENEILSGDDLSAALNLTDGNTVPVEYRRGNKVGKTEITPKKSENGTLQIGIFVKDSAAGIGTLTFILPESGRFGCLGHGITDPDTDRLFSAKRGDLYPAQITSVRKGKSGSPGELQGTFSSPALGNAEKNVETGLFGRLNPDAFSQRGTVETADKSEIKEGAVTVRCTVDGKEIRDYSAEITRIYRTIGGTTKNFLIKITDPQLLAKTGGIVQGMSGSPIFQNGKLVGAVTHVLVNDPTCGYGIFIENMLNEAA